MKPKIKIVEATIEAPMKDIKTLKSTNAIGKDDVVKVVPDGQKTTPTSSNSTVTTGMPMTEDIEPQDPETIKYLSNVKDSETGEISKPFNLGGKNYQMVRGILPSKDIVMAVYCHDDLNEAGENIIHPMDYFDEKIAKPIKERDSQNLAEDNFDYASQEREHTDKNDFINHLNLSDLVGYKHFFVNIKTGEIVAKFKTTKEMIKSGVKLGPNEDYMDAKTLKRFRFGNYFKNDVSEEVAVDGQTNNINVPKLQADVAKLVNQMNVKFGVYLSKLTKPLEISEFLITMAKSLGVPVEKISSLIAQNKDVAVPSPELKPTALPQSSVNEAKIITKNQLVESLNKKNIIKTVKIKDIK